MRVSPCWASDFFLLVQKEVTKKKDTRFRSRFPLRSNRSPVRFAAGGASGNSPYRAQTPARFSRQLLQCSAAPTGLSILRALAPQCSQLAPAFPFGGAEKRRFASGQSEHCSSPVASIDAEVELRSDRCKPSIAGNPKGAGTGVPFFLPTSFWAGGLNRSAQHVILNLGQCGA